MSSPFDGSRPDPLPFDRRHPAAAAGDAEAEATRQLPVVGRRPLTEQERLEHEMFALADTNHDGVLSRTEQLAFRAYLTRAQAGKEIHEPLPNDPVPHPDDLGPLAWHEFVAGDLPPARQKRWRRVAGRALGKAWGDSLFGLSAQAAFWCALSTAPILLALLGLVGLIAPLFGPDTIATIQEQVDRFLHQLFNPEVATNLVGNTVETILSRGRTDVVSVGLIISLWAGSSAMSAFVEAITVAYRQHEFRHPVAERFFALALYLIALVFGILLLPLIAIGPEYLVRLFPQGWRDSVATIIQISYYPATVLLLLLLLTTLYKVAPKVKHPWARGIPGALLAAVMFLLFSFGLRLYLAYVYSHGLTYGALATPITFLLFYYFAAMAIILGAQFNNALLEYFPVHKRTKSMRVTHSEHDHASAPPTDTA
ncbi:MAG: YihY/virulence factor BrkB family protein [Nakamurella sp.]